jgi:hypothetical protein
MNHNWSSLYLSTKHLPDGAQQQAAATLNNALERQGYTAYDPFGALPGVAYADTVKLFVAPASAGWTRILSEPVLLPDWLLSALSRVGLLLWVALDAETLRVAVYADGQTLDPFDALSTHLRADTCAPDDLRRALAGECAAVPDESEPAQTAGIPLDALPPEMQTLVHNLNPRQVTGLFNKLMGRVTGRVDTDVDSARALLAGSGPAWNSDGGRCIRALMACLDLPENWREPDFVTLRDAYQLQRRRQRLPNATLYPGDAEALAAVPDALDYSPVYAGRSEPS